MQKNYVQEILNIIHGNIPQAELAEKLSDYHEKDLADALEALMPAERKSLYPILGVDEVAEILFIKNKKTGCAHPDVPCQKPQTRMICTAGSSPAGTSCFSFPAR